MKRVLAVAVAALLVGVAIVVRGAIDDGGDGSDEGGDEDGPTSELVVACVRELADACDALDADVRVQDPADTVVAADEIDAWVTFDPWPAIAAEAERREVLGGDRVAVAASDLVLVARTTSLPDSCDDPPDWACVVDVPVSSGPTLPPIDSALGRLVLGHAALGWNAEVREGEPFARNEFELPEFQAWFRALRFSRDPLGDMFAFSPAGPAATGTTRAAFTTEVTGTREDGRLVGTPTVVDATIAVVVVGPAARRIADDDGLLDGLADLGWDVGVDPDDVTTGLPGPGVLFALQELS